MGGINSYSLKFVNTKSLPSACMSGDSNGNAEDVVAVGEVLTTEDCGEDGKNEFELVDDPAKGGFCKLMTRGGGTLFGNNQVMCEGNSNGRCRLRQNFPYKWFKIQQESCMRYVLYAYNQNGDQRKLYRSSTHADIRIRGSDSNDDYQFRLFANGHESINCRIPYDT